jgi:hypothetical protein
MLFLTDDNDILFSLSIRFAWKAHKFLIGEPKGKSPLRRLKHKEESVVITCLRKMGCEHVDWIHVE